MNSSGEQSADNVNANHHRRARGAVIGSQRRSTAIPAACSRKYAVGSPKPPPAGIDSTTSWARPETRNTSVMAALAPTRRAAGRKIRVCAISRKARFQRLLQKSFTDVAKNGQRHWSGASVG